MKGWNLPTLVFFQYISAVLFGAYSWTLYVGSWQGSEITHSKSPHRKCQWLFTPLLHVIVSGPVSTKVVKNMELWCCVWHFTLGHWGLLAFWTLVLIRQVEIDASLTTVSCSMPQLLEAVQDKVLQLLSVPLRAAQLSGSDRWPNRFWEEWRVSVWVCTMQ